ncbi:glutamine synthetase III, partial [Hymenobacter crusticola]
MSILRFKALELVDRREPVPVVTTNESRSATFGKNVFNLEAMRATMSGSYLKKLEASIKEGAPVERSVADAVASAMKTWAMAKGATHYTH